MKIASIKENQKIEKRIAITPEIAKKYLSLGFEVSLSENYASHLGIKDEEYKDLGVLTSNDEKKILVNAESYRSPNLGFKNNTLLLNILATLII